MVIGFCYLFRIIRLIRAIRIIYMSFNKYKILNIGLIIILSLNFINITFAQDISGIDVLGEQIQSKKAKVDELQAKVRQLQSSIKARHSQAASLQNQLTILDQRIEQVEIESEITQNQIDQTNLEIAQTQAKISQTESTINSEKDKLALFIRRLNKLDQKSGVEIFLLNKSISEYFNQLEANIKLQEFISSGVGNLKIQKVDLLGKVKNLKDQQSTLEVYDEKLATDQFRLEDQSAARNLLLAETKNSESRFQSQLHEAKAEQVQINVDIQTIEKVIRQKLAGQGPAALQKLGRGPMIYPVPFRGITATFHDPDYPFRYIFEHPAIDLRAAQATPVKAALPGFVARTRDGGLGYSYVMIIHADGLSTVYGHISRILVKEDEFVNQGDIIALTGGLPGTPGAGRLTTGPHLHFETRLNGIPVNPLNYIQ